MYLPRLLVPTEEVQENEEGKNWEGEREREGEDLGMEVMEAGRQHQIEEKREKGEQSQ